MKQRLKNLIAHKDKEGEEEGLRQHLKRVSELVNDLIKRDQIKYDLKSVGEAIAKLHDLGKATKYFQEYIRDQEKFNDNYNAALKRHSKISSYCCYYILKHKIEEADEVDSIIGFYLILKHHTNLRNLGYSELSSVINSNKVIKKQVKDLKKNLDEIEELFDKNKFKEGVKEAINKLNQDMDGFQKEIKRDLLLLQERVEDLNPYLKTLYLYSVLLDADKLKTAQIEIKNRKNLFSGSLVDEYIEEIISPEENKLNELRDKAKSEITQKIEEVDLNERLFSINLPTGAGKTLSALKSALILRERIKQEKDFKPRIIYSLPFLSIIEQNHEVINDVMKYGFQREPSPQVLLKHHYLSKGYATNSESEDPVSDLLLTESWYSEFIITTFFQLFKSLLTNKNNRAKKFHNITNSIIILDEIQSIPRKYWKLVNNLLKLFSEKFNTWIILMTATKPLIFQSNEIYSLVEEPNTYYNQLERVNYRDKTKEINKISELANKIIKESDETDEDIMAVLNTISSAERLFSQLNQEKESIELIYLSTNLLPKHRLERINKIKELDKQKIIVTTQLVEAGVDIDVDKIYRDFAPIDSIIQAAGRCNREYRQEKGELKITELKDTKNYDKNFYSYIYDSTLTNASNEVLTEKEEISTLELSDNYFERVKDWGSDKESNEILESVEQLNYSATSEFKLIEEDYETISVYLEIDEEAEEIKERVKELFEKEWGYEKKGKMLSLKRDFYNHIIDIKIDEEAEEKLSSLTNFLGKEGLLYVSKSELDNWYDPDLGFNLPESTFENRLI